MPELPCWVLILEPDALLHRLWVRWHTLQGQGTRLEARCMEHGGISQVLLAKALSGCVPGHCVVMAHARWVSLDVLETLEAQADVWGTRAKVVLVYDALTRREVAWPALMRWHDGQKRRCEVTWIKRPFGLHALRAAMTPP